MCTGIVCLTTLPVGFSTSSAQRYGLPTEETWARCYCWCVCMYVRVWRGAGEFQCEQVLENVSLISMYVDSLKLQHLRFKSSVLFLDLNFAVSAVFNFAFVCNFAVMQNSSHMTHGGGDSVCMQEMETMIRYWTLSQTFQEKILNIVEHLSMQHGGKACGWYLYLCDLCFFVMFRVAREQVRV